MNDFLEYWKTSLGVKKKEEVVSALKSDSPVVEVFIDSVKLGNYDFEDKYFDELLDIRGIDIQNENFDSCDLSYINFSYATFVNCTFRKVNIFCSRLHKTNFIDCKFGSCSFDGVYGYEANFSRCKIKKSSFNSCYFVRIKVDNSRILEADFSSARLVSPVLLESIINTCDFSWARIAPTESFVTSIKKYKETINLSNLQWLEPNGMPIENPII
ncbi:pentapeptide repeat-containing protein [Hahella sp. KA22]|uniref:pentapeptide repeat-containing protein n=1 Tax=Hahella sp. KA22 TaxID=1628392 RepID=UPI000FDD9BEE|nr:pentapeptide repeat-containing protein [Hahella sp. KA22]AZZ90015.1 pentapeptide repeat-containing protein [Hahella sp. KA22]QAY53385.1 pentapeptide repeat-containing protein [Hahella sp. KA22]